MYYSQNDEQRIIQDYFQGLTGVFLDLGANDGITLSNTHALALNGWKGLCVEPSPIPFRKLQALYSNNPHITCINIAIAEYNGTATLYDSNSHLSQDDWGLLSTLKQEETDKWNNQHFTKETIQVATYNSLIENSPHKVFDLISIDCEGMDYQILTQINLSDCKMLIVETNSIADEKYIAYCSLFKMKVIAKNTENLILTK